MLRAPWTIDYTYKAILIYCLLLQFVCRSIFWWHPSYLFFCMPDVQMHYWTDISQNGKLHHIWICNLILWFNLCWIADAHRIIRQKKQKTTEPALAKFIKEVYIEREWMCDFYLFLNHFGNVLNRSDLVYSCVYV